MVTLLNTTQYTNQLTGAPGQVVETPSVQGTAFTQVGDVARAASAVRVEGDSIRLHPEAMLTGYFYTAVLNGEPYLYRKTSDSEIEVYGLDEGD